jgi:hypothetical protein
LVLVAAEVDRLAHADNNDDAQVVTDGRIAFG